MGASNGVNLRLLQYYDHYVTPEGIKYIPKRNIPFHTLHSDHLDRSNCKKYNW